MLKKKETAVKLWPHVGELCGCDRLRCRKRNRRNKVMVARRVRRASKQGLGHENT